MGKSKRVEIGARYYFDIHMGIGLNTVDEICEIKVGDRTAWSGSRTTNGWRRIYQSGLFGGDDGEGGIEGRLTVMFGDPDQPVFPWTTYRDGGLVPAITTVHGSLLPAFRGVCTVFFSGLVTSMSKYAKPWSFRVRSGLRNYPGGVWYPEKAIIDIDGVKAMNPAHILHRCCVDKRFGRRLPLEKLGSSFEQCADTLFEEGFGMCIGWVNESPVTEFMDVILETIGASIFQHPQTGLIEMSLTRDDYDMGDLLVFSPDSGLLEIIDDNNAGSSSSINEVIVEYTNPANGDVADVGIQNIAAIHNAGGAVRSVKLQFPGVPSGELALRIAQRELRMRSAGIKTFTVILDRRGLQVLPGSAFIVQDPARGIAQIVVRAGQIDYGTLADGRITIQVVQDVFGMPATSFTGVSLPVWVPPNIAPQLIDHQRVLEASYVDLYAAMSQADLEQLSDDSCVLMALAERPQALASGFIVQTRISPAEYRQSPQSGSFSPTALLGTAIDVGEDPVEVSISGGIDLSLVHAGTAALLNEELVRVDEIDTDAMTVTLARGCGDSLPKAHAINNRIWFYGNLYAGIDSAVEYLPAQTVDTKLITRTSSGVVNPALVTAESVTMAQRKHRPYPPARLRINGEIYPDAVDADDIQITWAYRNRLTQAEQLIDASVGTITPETGTTVTIRVYTGDRLLRSADSITTTFWTYSVRDIMTDGDFSSLRFEVESERDELLSLQHYSVPVSRPGSSGSSSSADPFFTPALYDGTYLIGTSDYLHSPTRLAYSDDSGVTWAVSDEDIGFSPMHFAYGLGLYVAAVNHWFGVASAVDGEWTSATVGTETINDLIFDGTRFVAVRADKVLTSTDGETWTNVAHNLNGVGSIKKIRYIGSLYFAVFTTTSTGLTSVYSSSDRVTWTVSYANVTVDGAAIVNVASANGVLFAMGSKTVSSNERPFLLRSLDNGTTWADVSPVASTTNDFGMIINGISRIGTNYVCLGSKFEAYSSDLSSWTVTEPAIPRDYSGNAVIVDSHIITTRSYYTRPELVTTADGITWTLIARGGSSSGSADPFYYPALDDGTYLVGRGDYAHNPGRLVYSDDDGTSWAVSTHDMGFAPDFMVHGLGLYVTAVNHWFGVTSSVSGAWASSTVGSDYINDLIFDGTQFVAVRADKIVISTDGVSWTNVAHNLNGSTGELKSIHFDSAYFAVFLYKPTGATSVYSSTDLATWTECYANDTVDGGFIRNIASANGVLFAMGLKTVAARNRPFLLSSTDDGDTWTDVSPVATTTNSFGMFVNGMAYIGTNYVVLGTNFEAYSSDLSSWTVTEPVLPRAYSADAVISGSNLYATRSYYTTPELVYTTDGETWTVISL